MAPSTPALPSDPNRPEAPSAAREILTSRPVRAVLLVVVMAVAAEYVPWLAPLRVLSPRPTVEATAQAPALAAPLQVGEAVLAQPSEGHAVAPGAAPTAVAERPGDTAEAAPKVQVLDPTGHALDGLFSALHRTDQKLAGAVTRIVHFGDSIVAGDLVSGTLRRKLQTRFGDAGHGFTLIANAWPAYFHNDIERYATAGWKVSRVVGPLASDGFYGLGCVSFSAEKNVLARFGSSKSGDFGRNVAKFTLSYLSSPTGGSFEVSIDGKAVGSVDTRADTTRSEWKEFSVADGPHELTLLTKSGVSRLFGAVLERDTPGVVLDAIGIQGARVRFLDKQDDAHWAEQLAQRKPNLLVYQFGANESADGTLYPMVDYRRTLREVVAQGQRAVPQASCLIVAAMDRAQKKGEELTSVGVIPLLVREQRAVAEELGCAFFDTYDAMGGRGSMAQWVRRGLGQADLTHPSGAGAELIGTWIYRALLARYREFATGTPNSGPNTAPATSSPSLR